MAIPIETTLSGGVSSAGLVPESSSFDWGSLWSGAKDAFALGSQTWLQYQQGKRTGDFTGTNQEQVYNAATTAQPNANPTTTQTAATVGGVPVTYLAFGGLLLVGAVLVMKS